MRKFLKTSHVISRIFLYLSVIGVLLLYFFKPGVISVAQQFVPTADTGAWLALVTTLSIAAVMFAASELAYKSLTDNEFMITLSTSILETTYGRYDLSDRRFSKPAKGEFEFNQGLRDVTDEKERVMYELAWEKQNNKALQKKTVGNMIVALIFFIAGLVFFFCPVVWYPITKGLMSFETGTVMDYFSLVAVILTLFIIFEIGNNQGPIRRLNTILSIRSRSDELHEKPVLPAFSGHVPREITRLYPDAPVTKNEDWSGYQPEYACTFLDPMSDLFTEIQKKFVQKETEIYGTDHIYGIDIFNELTPPSWEPEYLGRVSRQVYESLEKADPEATWLQMGWLFYNERKYWTEDRVEAYLTSFPKEKQLILDYFCDRQEVWKRTESFYGVPYIWCYLGNFGGNTALVGKFNDLNEKIENALVNGGPNMSGVGATLEGFDCNPYVYEYIFEKAWTLPQHKDVAVWTEGLADQRVGFEDPKAREAWKILVDSVYVDSSTPGQASFVNQRPAIGRTRTWYGNARLRYDNKYLCEALGLLLEVDGKNSAYAFDLANLTRQMLANRFDALKKQYEAAVAEKDRETMKTVSAEMLEIIADIDQVIGTHSYFLVGKWIADARSWGLDDGEKAYFERNARNLITTWSDKDMLLNDYASRTWNGLTGTFYKVRWKMFFDAVLAAYDAGEPFVNLRGPRVPNGKTKEESKRALDLDAKIWEFETKWARWK